MTWCAYFLGLTFKVCIDEGLIYCANIVFVLIFVLLGEKSKYKLFNNDFANYWIIVLQINILEISFVSYVWTILIFRYLHHRRWIWTIQYSSALVLLPQASIAKILSTLTKVRQLEGFSYAHSKNGIQTMMLELPMSINGDDGSNVSCVVQYVIFPPHSTAGT